MKNTIQNGFLTIPEEKLILIEREHPLFFIIPIIIISSLTISAIAFSTILATTFPLLRTLTFSGATLILCLGLLTVFQVIVRWYLHFYIVTSHKILDIAFSPFCHQINDVLLDQVRCTEIDIQMGGFFNEILDMGDVLITFDRPTHQETLKLYHLHHPRELGMKLSDVFAERHETAIPVWYRTKGGHTLSRFTEEIFPKGAIYA